MKSTPPIAQSQLQHQGRSKVRGVLLIATGALIGGLGASLAAHLGKTDPRANAPTPHAESGEAEQAGPGSNPANARLIALEQAVARIEGSSREVANKEVRWDAEQDRAERTSTYNDIDDDAVEAQALEHFRKLVDLHQSEPVDPKWAREAAGVFGADVERLAKDGSFATRSLSCRFRSCLAFFEWDSIDRARAELPTLLHFRYGINCARTIQLDPSDSGASGPIVGRMYFECAAPPNSQRN